MHGETTVMARSEIQKPKFEIVDLEKYKAIITSRFQNESGIGNELEAIAGALEDAGDEHQIVYPNTENPKYFLKMRDKIYPERYQEYLKRDYAISNPETFKRERKAERVWGSVMNELSISADIQEALKDDEVLKKVKEASFENITFIEPLGAFVQKKTGHKFVIYPYKDMEEYKTTRELVDTVWDALVRRGIYPSDLKRASFKFSGKELYLFDAEGYYEIPK